MQWLRWVFAVAMLGVVGYHLVRLFDVRRRRPAGSVGGDATHAAMGLAMGAMLIGALDPSADRRLAWVFAVPLSYFFWRGLHGFVMDGPRAIGSCARHVVGCAAMIYMLVVMSAGTTATAMAGMVMPSTSDSPATPLVTVALIVATMSVAAWSVSAPRAVGLAASPALATGCQLAMSATTVWMLVAI